MDRIYLVPVRTCTAGLFVLRTGRLSSGERVGLAFTSKAALARALGPSQKCVHLAREALDGMLAPPDTRTKILDAAEHLFAERGFRGASVRATTDLAGANLAAVGYHFGSKAELLAAVARRVIEPINTAQSARLDRLLARTPDPPVTELVEAFAGPLFDEMPAGNEGGARTSRLIVTIITDPAEEMRSWTGPAEDTVRDRYLAAAMNAPPTG